MLDLTLPDSDGLDTLDAAHKHSSWAPIVVLTGLNDEALGVEAVKRGAQDYLVKGFGSGEVLARALRYAIEKQRFADELEARRLDKLRHQEGLNQELAFQNQELEEFASVASHDLQEPLRKLISLIACC